MKKERYQWLTFLDRLFPDMPKGLIVKVLDKRFKKGFYYGVIRRVRWSEGNFKVYVVGHLVFQDQEFRVFRDHIEVPEKGNKKELIKECKFE